MRLLLSIAVTIFHIPLRRKSKLSLLIGMPLATALALGFTVIRASGANSGASRPPIPR
jgi:hypothetical protein